MRQINQSRSRGMALGMALIAIMLIGVMIAVFLQRNKGDRQKVEMEAGRRILLSQGNATYDFLMDATIETLKEYTNKCSPIAGPTATATLNVRNSNGQATTILTPCPGTVGNLNIDPALWGKIEALIVSPLVRTRFKCLQGCVKYTEMPKIMATTIEQRDEKSETFYVQISGRFEVVRGSISEFSVGALAVEPNQNVKFVNGTHGDLAVFFKLPDSLPPPPANPCYGGDAQNPAYQERTIYLMPPEGSSLNFDSLATNAQPESVCLGKSTSHTYGESWAYSLTNLGTVNINKGVVITSSFFDEFRQQLVTKYNQGMSQIYWPAFNQWNSINNPIGAGNPTGLNPFSASLFSGILSSLISRPGAGYTAPFTTSQDDFSEYGGEGGYVSPSIASATLYLGNCGANADGCQARLVEHFVSNVNDHTEWVVYQGVVSPNLALFTQAPIVRVQRFATDSNHFATIGPNNLYLFTSGEIKIMTSIKKHPGLAGFVSDDVNTQGHLGLVSIANNTRIGSDFETLDGSTLGAHYAGPAPTTQTVQIEAGMISAAENRAPFEFADGLLAPPQDSSIPKTIGTGSFSGPIWGAYQTTMRTMNDQGTQTLTGFSQVATAYPNSWRSDPRLSIQVSSLPTARDLGRSFEFIDFKKALEQARVELGLSN